MSRLSGASRLKAIGHARLCGVAITVRTAPGDNLMVQKAVTMSGKGHVVVVDAGGELLNAVVGDRIAAFAARRGIAGMVIHGAVRDVAALRAQELPIFASGISHRGPFRNGPGEINYPISVDGMRVDAGDIVIGDEDGVIAISARDAVVVCAAAEALVASDRMKDPALEDREWIDRSLRALGCEWT